IFGFFLLPSEVNAAITVEIYEFRPKIKQTSDFCEKKNPNSWPLPCRLHAIFMPSLCRLCGVSCRLYGVFIITLPYECAIDALWMKYGCHNLPVLESLSLTIRYPELDFGLLHKR